MRTNLKSITRILKLPAICILCKQYHDTKETVCKVCINFFQKLDTACKICKIPITDNDIMLCGMCITKKPYFDNVYTNYIYDEPLKTLLHEFKYYNGLYLSTFINSLMLDAGADIDTECLIPVPMHPEKLQQRGFNQAAILTGLLAKSRNLPYDFFYCQKRINTSPQAKLNAKQRIKNLKNSFSINHNVARNYQNITLVDDLLTTGSTANELAKILKQQGIKKVSVWCVARAV